MQGMMSMSDDIHTVVPKQDKYKKHRVSPCNHEKAADHQVLPELPNTESDDDSPRDVTNITNQKETFYRTEVDAVSWHYLVERREKHKQWLTGLLSKHGCRNILDVSCGTGHDSIILVEAGFRVISTDVAPEMLKMARSIRQARLNEPGFEQWVISKANWLTLPADISQIKSVPESGYDAILCLGNSFCHLETPSQRHLAISNFHKLLRPGGIIMFCNRNYEHIFEMGGIGVSDAQFTSPYMIHAVCELSWQQGKPHDVTVDYTVDMDKVAERYGKKLTSESTYHLRIHGYPVFLDDMVTIIKSVFGEDAPYDMYGDLVPLSHTVPGYYRHVVQKITHKSLK